MWARMTLCSSMRSRAGTPLTHDPRVSLSLGRLRAGRPCLPRSTLLSLTRARRTKSKPLTYLTHILDNARNRAAVLPAPEFPTFRIVPPACAL